MVVESLEREVQDLRSLLHSERDPQGRAFVPLADAYRRAGRLDEALDVVTEGLQRHASLSSGHVVLARVHRDRGEGEAARRAYERVLELDGENVEALREMGILHLDAGRSEDARPLLQKARALDPEDPEVRARLTSLTVMEMGGAAPAEPEPPSAGPTGEVERPSGQPPVPDEVEASPPVVAAAGEALLEGLPEVPVGAGEDVEEFEPLDLSLDASAFDIEPAGEEAPELGGFEMEPVSEAPEELERPVPAAAAEALLGAAEIAEAWGEDAPAELPATRTMAELFARQGLTDRAAGVYERLLEERPDDEDLRRRLEQLRGTRAAPLRRDEKEDETETLAREMSESSGHAGELSSPFAWAEEEPSLAVDDGPPVRDYFRRLLAWEPGEEVAAPDTEPGEVEEEPEAALPALDLEEPVEEPEAALPLLDLEEPAEALPTLEFETPAPSLEVASTEAALAPEAETRDPEALLAAGDLDAAEEVLRSLLELEPDDVSHHQLLVELAYRRGDLGARLEAYRGLARCLDRLGRPQQGEAIYRQVLEIDPEDPEARAALAPPAEAAEPAVAETPASEAVPVQELAPDTVLPETLEVEGVTLEDLPAALELVAPG